MPVPGRAPAQLSPEEAKAWLDTGLPPLVDPAKPPPFELLSVRFSVSGIEQQFVKAEFRRKWLVTILPKELNLVILPVQGGRYAIYCDPSIVNGPIQGGTIEGILDGLLDYRGNIPGGARAYLEMRPSSPIDQRPPVRLSSAIWAGTDAQLAAARQKGPPADPNQGSPKPAIVPLPAELALPEGTPVRFLAGPNWVSATVGPATAGERLTLILFLARPHGLIKPWQVVADRRDIKIEASALEELQRNQQAFAERSASFRQQLAGMDAPKRLDPAKEPLEIGQRLLGFWQGGIDTLEVIGSVQNGVVPVQRTVLDHLKSEKPLSSLYLDPEQPLGDK